MHTRLTPNPIRTHPANDFAHNTVTHRLPKNICNVVETNDFSPTVSAALATLADEIAGNAVIPPPPFPAWDYDTWHTEWSPHAGSRWHDVEWFFAETYGFRVILERTRYFETYHDPYAPLKQRELDTGSAFLPIQRFFVQGSPAEALLAVGASDVHDSISILEEALHLSMWGNKADISFASGGELDHSVGDRELLLIDHSVDAAQRILREAGPERPVHIIMDNSGAELAGDLVLARVIVALTGAIVVLHPKLYPTYVSDTTAPDIHHFLETAATGEDDTLRRFATSTRALVEQGAIAIAPDDYWCTTRFMAEVPSRIKSALETAAVVVVKGDFNYRRVMRDTIWPAGTDSRAAAAVDLDAPLLLLRTLKSDCLVGVPETTITALDAATPGWRTDGKRGVIQLLS